MDAVRVLAAEGAPLPQGALQLLAALPESGALADVAMPLAGLLATLGLSLIHI